MSEQHRGTFQYWKPNRRITFSQWSRRAWFIALALSLGSVTYAVVTTIVLVSQELSRR